MGLPLSRASPTQLPNSPYPNANEQGHYPSK